jgi:CubicO group peptidase (beta-lactamase class C family)
MNFDAFVNDIETNKWNVFGTEVYVNGLLAHSYGDTTGIHELYSATKTILSIAVGIAYDKKIFDIDRPFICYIPGERLGKLSDDQRNTLSRISIKRLLTMSVADLPFRPEGDSWLDFSLSQTISDTENKSFHYNNINSYLVGVCLTEALGSDLGSFIEERIFRPLEINTYEYTRCPEGYFYGASGTRLSVHDLSKIGLLLYNKGIYQGTRIVSEEYVKLATSVQQMNREGGYGFYIWKYRDGFSINGKWKQKCYVLPARGIIVTYLSHIEDDSHDLLDSMEKNILGA